MAETNHIQTQADGTGPRYHRRNSIDLSVGFEAALKTMADLKLHPNHYSPNWIASFEKTKGSSKRLAVGDEFLVHISGPWNGPVRVSAVSEASFTLETLEGHLEAGQICFSLHSRDDGGAKFEIESITRSKDKIVDFIYDKLRLAQLAQSEMWETFCKNFARRALDGAGDIAEVVVHTEKQNPANGVWEDVSNQMGAHGLI